MSFEGVNIPAIFSPRVVVKALKFDSTSLSQDSDTAIQLPVNSKRWSRKRMAEYRAGRLCAGEALRNFGVEAALPADEHGLPCWPKGFVGSISHSHGLAAAVVAPLAEIKMLGLDIEQVVSAKVRETVFERIISPEEKALFNSLLPDWPSVEELFTLFFSAKEAVFKAFCPKESQAVFWGHIQLTKVTAKAFSAKLDQGREVYGTFALAQGYIWTVVEG